MGGQLQPRQSIDQRQIGVGTRLERADGDLDIGVDHEHHRSPTGTRAHLASSSPGTPADARAKQNSPRRRDRRMRAYRASERGATMFDDPDLHFTDDELTRLALAADPDAPLPPDAVSLWDPDRSHPGLLPAWYMPPPTGGRHVRGWRRRLIILLVVAFVLIDAYGLCSTYGSIVIA